MPYLKEAGGEIIYLGKAGNFLIGPANERWDAVMLVCQRSVSDFLKYPFNSEYMDGMGHRTAALEDLRLLPLIDDESMNA